MTSTLVQDILGKRELSFTSNGSEDTGYSANSYHSSFSEGKCSPSRVVYSVNGYSASATSDSTRLVTGDATPSARQKCHLNENKRSSNITEDIKYESATGTASSAMDKCTPSSRRSAYLNESRRHTLEDNKYPSATGYLAPTTRRRAYTAGSKPINDCQGNDHAPPAAVVFTTHKIKRSPCSTTYLSDIKEKLLQEVTKIDIELKTIEEEKCILLDVRVLVHNFRNALWDSERNSQGLLVPEKVKVVIEKIITDVNAKEEALLKEDGIPYFMELCKQVTKVKNTSSSLVEGAKRLNIEDVEELFSQSGQLYGIIDAMLVIFYEQPLAPECNEYENNKGGLANQDQTSSQATSEQSLPQAPSNHHSDSAICGKCMESINLDSSGSFDDVRVTNGYHVQSDVSAEKSNVCSDDSVENKESETAFEHEYKHIILSMVKDIGKMKKCLKSVDRMTSGRPKMKFLISKFQEVSVMLKPDYLEKLERYSYVLKANIHRLQQVLRTEKPGQCDLDNVRFLLSQLAGRANILLKLERAESQC